MAGKIYVTGDCHARFTRFEKMRFTNQEFLDKEDFVIICGDFGGIWDTEESAQEKYVLDEMDRRSYTTLFVDGNHENHERLSRYPVKLWHGGTVHEIRSSIYHLMRGQVYELLGKRIFTFGGAKSHDISAGILEPDDPEYKEKYKKLQKEGALFRVNHISWWKEELPSEEELEEARRNLEKVHYQVDYVFSHCASNEVQSLLSPTYDIDLLTNFFSEIREKLTYKKWYFGHYHLNMNVTEKDTVLYSQIIEAGEPVKKETRGLAGFNLGEEVRFKMVTPEGLLTLHGTIGHVDPYGSFLDTSQACYDIFAEYKGRMCYMKHIRESDILKE